MNKKLLTSSVAVALLSGCTSLPPKICTPDTRVNMASTDHAAATDHSLKIITLPVDMTESKDPAASRIKKTVLHELENQVANSGAKVVDRKLAKKLKNEIKLAEKSGRINTNGVAIADMAILTEIISSDLSYSYDKAKTVKNSDGSRKRIPSQCHFTTKVTGLVKVVSLPDMTVVDRFDIEGKGKVTHEDLSSKCPINSATYRSMATQASENAVKYNSNILKMLAPSAPILEMRQCEAGTMVKVAMGRDKHITPDTEVSFIKQMQVDGEVETFTYAQGKVIDNEHDAIKARYSWVAIDEDDSPKINKGDMAKVKPMECDDGFMNKFSCQFKEAMGSL